MLTIQATTTEEHANYENTGISNSKIHLLLQFGASGEKEYYQILVTMSRHWTEISRETLAIGMRATEKN